jgi:hypothetical protein
VKDPFVFARHYRSKAQSQALQDQSRRRASMDMLP